MTNVITATNHTGRHQGNRTRFDWADAISASRFDMTVHLISTHASSSVRCCVGLTLLRRCSSSSSSYASPAVLNHPAAGLSA
jgi:hypothetical protein